MNVADWIRKWAQLCPEKIAVVDNDQPMTYRELNRRVNALANYLAKKGVKKQERIAVLLRNCREFLEIFFAVSKAGAVFVPLNFRLTAPEITYVINDCTSETLFFDELFAETIEGIREDLPVKRDRFVCVGKEAPSGSHRYDDIFEECSFQEPVLSDGSSAEMPHIIMYTSGTTGLPKGAVLSQRKTLFQCPQCEHLLSGYLT